MPGCHPGHTAPGAGRSKSQGEIPAHAFTPYPHRPIVSVCRLFETVISSTICNVHAAKSLHAGRMTLTIIGGGDTGVSERSKALGRRLLWPINHLMISFLRKCGSSPSRAFSRRR